MQISIFVPAYGAIEGITPPFRVFQTVNDFLRLSGKEPTFQVEYIGLRDSLPANSGEYTIQTNRLLQEVNKTDLLIIPPIFGETSMAIQNNAEAIPHFTRLHKNGSSIASLCIGAFLLAETGLLKGKKCSTHWAYLHEFKKRYPDIEVEDGTIITEHERIYSSGGANSIWNLLLYLVEKYTDRETAILISKYFAIDIGRENQSQFAIFKGQQNHGDKAIQTVQQYIESNYQQKITIDTLANLVHVGRRTFERRFKEATHNTPIEYIQRVRIEVAKNHFEDSRKNVNEIMFDVGYTDTKAFREVFRKITGLTPVEYKNKFARS